MTSIGKRLGLGLTAPLTIAGGAALKLASDAQEASDKVQDVFGDQRKAVDDLAKSYQVLNKGAALDLLGTTGNILTAMGFTTEQAADLSVKVGTLARDMASFNNVAPAEAFQAINAALTGEAESMKRLGVVLQDAEVKARALADTGKATAESLTQQEVAAARLALIMEKSATQIGNYERTQDSLANRMRQFRTQLENIAIQFGEILMPAAQKVVGVLAELAERFGNLSPATQKVIVVVAAIAAAIGPLLIVLGTLMSAVGAIIPVFGVAAGAIAAISAPVAIVIAAVIALGAAFAALLIKSETFRAGLVAAFHAVWEAGKFVAEGLGNIWREWGDDVVGAVEFVINGLEALTEGLIATGESLWREYGDTITNNVRAAWDTVTSIVEGAVGVVGNAVMLFVNSLQGDWHAAWQNIEGIFRSFAHAVVGVADALWEAIKAEFVNEMNAVIVKVNEFVAKVNGALSTISFGKMSIPELPELQLISQRAEKAAIDLDKLPPSMARLLTPLMATGKAAGEAGTKLQAAGPAANALAAATEKLGSASKAAADEAQRLIERLDDQLRALTMTDEQLLLHDLRLANATQKERELALEKFRTIEAIRAQTEANEELAANAEKVIDANNRQIEAFKGTIEQLEMERVRLEEGEAAYRAATLAAEGYTQSQIDQIVEMEKTNEAIRRQKEEVDSWIDSIMNALGSVGKGIASIGGTIFGALDDLFGGALGKASGFIKNLAGGLLGGGEGALGGVFNSVAGFIGGPWGQAITGALDLLGIDIGNIVSGIAGKVGDLFGSIGKTIGGLFGRHTTLAEKEIELFGFDVAGTGKSFSDSYQRADAKILALPETWQAAMGDLLRAVQPTLDELDNRDWRWLATAAKAIDDAGGSFADLERFFAQLDVTKNDDKQLQAFAASLGKMATTAKDSADAVTAPLVNMARDVELATGTTVEANRAVADSFVEMDRRIRETADQSTATVEAGVAVAEGIEIAKASLDSLTAEPIVVVGEESLAAKAKVQAMTESLTASVPSFGEMGAAAEAAKAKLVDLATGGFGALAEKAGSVADLVIETMRRMREGAVEEVERMIDRMVEVLDEGAIRLGEAARTIADAIAAGLNTGGGAGGGNVLASAAGSAGLAPVPLTAGSGIALAPIGIGPREITIRVPVNLDGREIAEVVGHHIVEQVYTELGSLVQNK